MQIIKHTGVKYFLLVIPDECKNEEVVRHIFRCYQAVLTQKTIILVLAGGTKHIRLSFKFLDNREAEYLTFLFNHLNVTGIQCYSLDDAKLLKFAIEKGQAWHLLKK